MAAAGLPSVVLAQRAIPVQEALLRSKPAVVLVVAEVASEVTLDCGSGPQKIIPPVFRETGTGWLVAHDGWLMTNGHVVQPAYEPPRWLANQQAQRAVTTACLPEVLKRKGLLPGDSPEAEEAAKRKLLDTVLPTVKVTLQPQVFVVTAKGRLKAEVKKYSPPVNEMSGRDLALLKIPGENYPVLALNDSKTVQIGDPVHIIGFPGVVLSHELLNQSAMVEASITNGAVSGFKQDRNNNTVIQTDAPAAWGNSGGPTVDDRGNVAGLLTFVSLAPGPEGSIVQGFNFVIPSSAVTDFVKDMPVKLNGGSKFNDVWYAGLRAFFADDGKTALQRFEEADRLHPNLPDVRRMLAEARDKVKNPPPKPFPWFWVAVAVTLVSAGGFGGQWLHRWNKNRYRIQPSEVIRLSEGGKQPLILDARRTDLYEALPLKIKDSIRVAPEDLANSLAGLDLDMTRPVVAYCSCPDEETSAKVARELRKMGFKDVRILKGGLGAWTNAGLPIETRSDLSQVGLELYKALAGGNV
ncbi:MAG TPA: trypsin-like peptidase domain-containing protein [Candidatus Nitrosotalea sp.]|nr:trypsin-like peptidase domain-containing protein [Candidatus Nitrosotalea sp.]